MPASETSPGTFLLLGLAGALGTWMRYLVALGATRVFGPAFPMGTLAVNVLGCFLMGIVARSGTNVFSPTVRLILMTGFLGGLTTYSAFNNETSTLFATRGSGLALLNLLSTVLLCGAAGAAGAAVARKLVGAA